jgi:hypothetical protein
VGRTARGSQGETCLAHGNGETCLARGNGETCLARKGNVKKISIVSLLLLATLCFILAPVVARADSYQRLVITGTTSGSTSNTATFYNAKVLSVRAQNLAGVGCTNAIVVTQVTADNALTNTVASFTTTTNGASDVSASGFVQVRNDQLKVAATSNFVVEVTLDARDR